MRDRIKAVAEDLLIAHGIRGLTFGLIAERLGVPRPNIHYYYRNKTVLAEEVLADYATVVTARFSSIWTVTHLSLPAKFEGALASQRERYRRYNPRGTEGRPWALLTRLQQERDSLTPGMIETLRQAGSRLEQYGAIAVAQSLACGELSPDTPKAEVSLLVSNTVRFSGTLSTQKDHFDQVQAHYRAVLHTLGRAYGTPAFHRALAEVETARFAGPMEAAPAKGKTG